MYKIISTPEGSEYTSSSETLSDRSSGSGTVQPPVLTEAQKALIREAEGYYEASKVFVMHHIQVLEAREASRGEYEPVDATWLSSDCVEDVNVLISLLSQGYYSLQLPEALKYCELPKKEGKSLNHFLAFHAYTLRRIAGYYLGNPKKQVEYFFEAKVKNKVKDLAEGVRDEVEGGLDVICMDGYERNAISIESLKESL